MDPDRDDLDALWAAWKGDGDTKARDRLAEIYYGLTQRVAGRVAKSLPGHVDRDDIVSMGTLGLFRALERYDPSRGTSFETFCPASVRSLILDELRKQDWAPRSLRRRQREQDGARERLESDLGRSPTDDELAQELEVPAREVRDTRRRTEQSHHQSLDEHLEDYGEEAVAPEHPEASVVWATASRMIASLSVQEQVVLALVYVRRLTHAEIATALGVSEVRIGTLHAGAVVEVAEALAHSRESWS